MNYLVTHGGVTFDFENPRAEMILPGDLAHALSRQCRFSGHVSKFYSVAQHLVYCSHVVPMEDALAALLHDAQEAYVCDLPRYLKRCPFMEGYRDYERRAWKVVAARFGISDVLPKSVEVADLRMVLTEWRDLMPQDGAICLPERRENNDKPYDDLTIIPWSSPRAEKEFTQRLGELYAGNPKVS